MKTLKQLRDEVSLIVQDASFSDSDIDSLINAGLMDVAGQVFLPGLDTSSDVSTTSNDYVALPDGFHRGLNLCHSTTNNSEIKIYKNIQMLHRKFSTLDNSGRVVGVAVRGNNLHYQRIPSTAETLRLYYYEEPTVMTVDADEPECLPEFLARDLLVFYACREIYNLIEDGVDGQKTNTSNYEQRYNQALQKLVSFIGPDALNDHREPQGFEDEMDLDSYL